MTPVHVVHLYLAEVPVHLAAVFQLHEVVELVLGAVEGEAKVADSAGLLFLEKEGNQAVVYVAFVEGILSAAADGMQEIVVEVGCLELLKGAFVHLYGCFGRRIPEVRELGGNVVALTGMPGESLSGGVLAETLEVCGRGVEVIDAVCDGVIHHLVYGGLVYDVLAVRALYHGPAHAAESKQGHAVSVAGILTVNHCLGAFVACHARL